jgi:hypothetical protein
VDDKPTDKGGVVDPNPLVPAASPPMPLAAAVSHARNKIARDVGALAVHKTYPCYYNITEGANRKADESAIGIEKIEFEEKIVVANANAPLVESLPAAHRLREHSLSTSLVHRPYHPQLLPQQTTPHRRDIRHYHPKSLLQPQHHRDIAESNSYCCYFANLTRSPNDSLSVFASFCGSFCGCIVHCRTVGSTRRR